MSEERKKILGMLVEGKISVEEAERLLSAISESEEESIPGKKTETAKLKYLRVVVEPGPGSKNDERVNIRVPIKLIRAGIKLASLLPNGVQGKVDDALKEKGLNLDFSQINEENIEEIVESLRDLTVDVEGEERVRIYCE
jgi:DNA-directed RNA polymerase subunit F